MEKNESSVKKILDGMRRDLSGLYPERELDQILYMLVRHLTGWNKADLALKGNTIPGPDLADVLKVATEELRRFRPIQYIIGSTTFLGAELKVRPGVLIPRPETEELAALVIAENRQKEYQEFHFLDIGTGSGCLAIVLKKAFPYAKAEALDISAEALGTAAENALQNGAEIRFRKIDILDAANAAALPGYHLIVSNPPYVTDSERAGMRANVLEFEPAGALFVPDADPLLFYRAIGLFAWRHLVRPGQLYVEINERFGMEVKTLLQSFGFEKVELLRDLRGKDRFVRAEAKHVMADTSYWMVDKHLP